MNPHPTREDLGSDHLVLAARLSNRSLDQVIAESERIIADTTAILNHARDMKANGFAVAQFPTTVTGKPLMASTGELSRHITLVNMLRDIVAMAANEKP